METRSKARGAQIQTASRHVLPDPDARSFADPEDDLRLDVLMDDGAGAAVGGSRLEVGAATRPPGSAPIRADGSSFEEPMGPTQATVREPVAEAVTTFARLLHPLIEASRTLHWRSGVVRFLH